MMTPENQDNEKFLYRVPLAVSQNSLIAKFINDQVDTNQTDVNINALNKELAREFQKRLTDNKVELTKERFDFLKRATNFFEPFDKKIHIQKNMPGYMAEWSDDDYEVDYIIQHIRSKYKDNQIASENQQQSYPKYTDGEISSDGYKKSPLSFVKYMYFPYTDDTPNNKIYYGGPENRTLIDQLIREAKSKDISVELIELLIEKQFGAYLTKKEEGFEKKPENYVSLKEKFDPNIKSKIREQGLHGNADNELSAGDFLMQHDFRMKPEDLKPIAYVLTQAELNYHQNQAKKRAEDIDPEIKKFSEKLAKDNFVKFFTDIGKNIKEGFIGIFQFTRDSKERIKLTFKGIVDSTGKFFSQVKDHFKSEERMQYEEFVETQTTNPDNNPLLGTGASLESKSWDSISLDKIPPKKDDPTTSIPTQKQQEQQTGNKKKQQEKQTGNKKKQQEQQTGNKQKQQEQQTGNKQSSGAARLDTKSFSFLDTARQRDEKIAQEIEEKGYTDVLSGTKAASWPSNRTATEISPETLTKEKQSPVVKSQKAATFSSTLKDKFSALIHNKPRQQGGGKGIEMTSFGSKDDKTNIGNLQDKTIMGAAPRLELKTEPTPAHQVTEATLEKAQDESQKKPGGPNI